MTDEHSPEAVVERGTRWFHKFTNAPDWPTPEEEDDLRQAALDFMSNALQPGDRLPNNLVVIDRAKVLGLIEQYGGIDGAHHKQWVIDQLARALTDDYEAWVRDMKSGEDGPLTYEWDEGIAP